MYPIKAPTGETPFVVQMASQFDGEDSFMDQSVTLMENRARQITNT